MVSLVVPLGHYATTNLVFSASVDAKNAECPLGHALHGQEARKEENGWDLWLYVAMAGAAVIVALAGTSVW